MPNSEASIPDSATSLLTSAGAHSERAAAQAAYLALVQHLSGLPQDHFDAEVPSEASSITVGIRIVS